MCSYSSIHCDLRYPVAPLWLLDCPGQVSDFAWHLNHLFQWRVACKHMPIFWFNSSLSVSIGQYFVSRCIYCSTLHSLRYPTAPLLLLDHPGQVSDLTWAQNNIYIFIPVCLWAHAHQMPIFYFLPHWPQNYSCSVVLWDATMIPRILWTSAQLSLFSE